MLIVIISNRLIFKVALQHKSFRLEVTKNHPEIKELCTLLLRIGTLLMTSGANTERIRNTIQRISGSFQYKAELVINHRSILLSLENADGSQVYTSLKRTGQHGVNFRILSGISRMSWNVVDEEWSIQQINEEIDRLEALPHFPRMVVLLLVALAGASFCRLAGGKLPDMLFAFSATFIGLFVRQETSKLSFNSYLCVFFAAFAATLVAGLGYKLGIADPGNHGFVTSVLFLIPGVPLINSFSDLIDGNIQTGIIRGINGLIYSFAIALGLLTSILIYQM